MSILSRFKTIEKFCPYTGCFNATYFVCGALLNNWTDEQMKDKKHYTHPDNIFSPRLKQIFPSIVISFVYDHGNTIFSSHIFPSDACDLIMSHLEYYSMLTISIDGDISDHSFILFKSDGVYYIVDAYWSHVTKRSLSIRSFNTKDLVMFLTNPEVSQWNKLFICNEPTAKKFAKIDLSCCYLN